MAYAYIDNISMSDSFQIEGITEQFHEKDRNGDYILYQVIEKGNLVVALLADGVSNSPCDWLSSRITCEVFMEDFFTKSACQLEERICSAAEQANQALLYHSEHQGMLCAFSAVVWHFGSDEYVFVNIGDTRIYHVREEILEQISEDGADVQFLRRQGRVATDSYGHPLTRRVITNAVGSKTCRIMARKGKWQKGDLLILASDGFYNSYEIIEEVRVAIAKYDFLKQALTKVWCNNMDGFEDDASVVVLKW